MKRQCDHLTIIESKGARATRRAALATLAFGAGAAHATSLDGMFNHFATDTWYIGVPLGFATVFCARLLKTAVVERLWRAIPFVLLQLLLSAAFAIWIFLGQDDPYVVPITAGTLIGSVLILFVWRPGEAVDER